MKIGINAINNFPKTDSMIKLAQHAESVGIESVWTYEHVLVPLDYQSKYPYSPSGKMGVKPESSFFDPLIALTAIAGATTTLRLGTGVNILPQVKPLLLAKQAASLDQISGGRLLLGLGIGWLQEEFDAMDTSFEKRGARFDDYVAAMKKVWSGDVVEHQSEFLSWSGFKSYPLPQQTPLPVHIGGGKGKILDRVARLGEGWYVPESDPGRVASRLKELKQVCAEVDRDFSSIEITCGAAIDLDQLQALRDVGVHRATLMPFLPEERNPFIVVDTIGDVISKL